MIRLCILDDHPVVMMGVKLCIEQLGNNKIKVEACYVTGRELLADIDNHIPDVLLADLNLPDIKGTELIKKIHILRPGLKIGIYSSSQEKEDILNAFENGALGYLSKGAPAEELVNFIEKIYTGERYIPESIANVLFGSEKKPSTPARGIQLTQREQEVMELIVEGFKNKDIAEKLFISERTVEFHKQNIYSKYKVTNSTSLIKKLFNLTKLYYQLSL